MRKCTIYGIGKNEVEELLGWKDVIKKEEARLGPFISGILCEFDLAEEVVGLLHFEKGSLVEINEVLRPTTDQYEGTGEEASQEFLNLVNRHQRQLE